MKIHNILQLHLPIIFLAVVEKLVFHESSGKTDLLMEPIRHSILLNILSLFSAGASVRNDVTDKVKEFINELNGITTIKAEELKMQRLS
jgi:hypothetical protein